MMDENDKDELRKELHSLIFDLKNKEKVEFIIEVINRVNPDIQFDELIDILYESRSYIL